MAKLSNKVLVLLCISFIEGGLVMALELIVAKLVNPYFGGSIYIWAALLSVALSGLALGYYAGSNLTKKNSNMALILLYAIIASLFFLIPLVFFNTPILTFFGNLPIKTGMLLSAIVFLLPVLICWGIISPVIIKIIQQITNQKPGVDSALVYSVSTFGGVVFTLLFGFALIPYWGLIYSLKIVFFSVAFIALLAFTAKQ